ncbi:unnamed protein product [Cochlearia groenlandica]
MVKMMSCFMCMIMVCVISCVDALPGSKFNELYRSSWAMDHCINDGDVTKLKLDTSSGAGFESKSKYLFGKVSIQIKLVEGDSAGTVTAFYMSSQGANHNEFDFEFLGNKTGEPYIVQTNVYVNGVGNKEQRLNLWFDPTTEFHTYSILWSKRSVVFIVDETPIRVVKNLEDKGIPFAKDQAMGVYSSIWNADDWATQGGLVKTDWSHSPFIASYKSFKIDACEIPTTTSGNSSNDLSKCNGEEERFWWDEPNVSELSLHQNHQLIWVRSNHMIYDYCFDATRFVVTPLECQHHRHLL